MKDDMWSDGLRRKRIDDDIARAMERRNKADREVRELIAERSRLDKRIAARLEASGIGDAAVRVGLSEDVALLLDQDGNVRIVRVVSALDSRFRDVADEAKPEPAGLPGDRVDWQDVMGLEPETVAS